MFSLLKYVIFALGLLAAYVLIEHYVFNSEEELTVENAVNQAVSEVNNIGEAVNEEYIQPLAEQMNSD